MPVSVMLAELTATVSVAPPFIVKVIEPAPPESVAPAEPCSAE
ncbi:hypothetical protein GT370_20165 [Acidocella sp. MX-AZ03]|nr:hypothetical protein [Acidocella sp. MX-AZ03]WBO59312.1 hypothetical protein GT370_20165 [Acidocella sp. MX-AZ03]